jgi:large subunit ribosomal protein L18
MDHQRAKRRQQLRRRHHVRSHLVGTPQRPRLSVFRSNKHIYAQLIDDLNGVTLASASSQDTAPDAPKGKRYGGNVKGAQEVGKKLAEAARAKGIVLAAFDRGHYRFHGRVEALARAANEAGLKCCESRKPPKEPTAPAKGEKPEKAEKGQKPPKGEKAEKPKKAKAEAAS